MDSVIKLQMQVKENAEDTKQFLTDLTQWEKEMKRKDAEIAGKEIPLPIEIPSIRNKKKSKKKTTSSIKKSSSSDYAAWEKFDVDKACKDIDKEEDDDENDLEEIKKENQRRERATYEKDLGNTHFRKNDWKQSIQCYTRAIECLDQDPTFYANRGMCYIKTKEWLKAEADLTKALQLDPTYVKAFYRRGLARFQSGHLLEAREDFKRCLELDLNNIPCKNELEKLDKRIEELQLEESTKRENENIEEEKVEEKSQIKKNINITNKNILGEYTEDQVIELIRKPPHLRSKKPLSKIEIEEVDELSLDDKISEMSRILNKSIENQEKSTKIDNINDNDIKVEPKIYDEIPQILIKPKSSSEFSTQWRNLKNYPDLKYEYLKLLEPAKIPEIFNLSLESELFSSILEILESHFMKNTDIIIPFLEGFTKVERFVALVLFLTDEDKRILNNLLEYSEKTSHCDHSKIEEIAKKFNLI